MSVCLKRNLPSGGKAPSKYASQNRPTATLNKPISVMSEAIARTMKIILPAERPGSALFGRGDALYPHLMCLFTPRASPQATTASLQILQKPESAHPARSLFLITAPHLVGQVGFLTNLRTLPGAPSPEQRNGTPLLTCLQDSGLRTAAKTVPQHRYINRGYSPLAGIVSVGARPHRVHTRAYFFFFLLCALTLPSSSACEVTPRVPRTLSVVDPRRGGYGVEGHRRG